MSAKKDQPAGTFEFGSPDSLTIPTGFVGDDPYLGMTLKDRYLIEKELGKGGIGVVYLASDKQLLSRPVVVKVLLEESAKNDWFKKKFSQEIEALARIEHPGVVGVLDAGQMPDGKPYIVMQFVQGIDLRSAMSDEGMEFDRVAEILRQIGQALSAAHDKGVYHRDLKPENIMLQCLNECEQQVKLIDFGIAKVIDSKVASDNDSTTVAGTISYMAPEQLMGKPSASSDVYALGVIAYEMLCGQKPFKPNTPYELLDMQREGVKDNPSDLRPDLPKAAETAILKALAFEQDVRHARARDFGEEMANALTLRASQSSGNENEIAPIPNDYSGAAFAQGEQVAEAGYFEIPAVTPKVVPDPLSQTGSFWSRRKSVAIPAIAILIALVAVALISQRLIKKPFVPIKPVVANEVSTGNAGLTRKLSYSVTLLRDPDTFPRSKPLRLPRETLFSMGDRIRLDIFSPQVGWLYILNERPAIEGETSKFNLMFPFPLTKQYSAEVSANQPVLVPGEGYFILDNEKGAERVWLIWSASRVPELDILKKWVNEKDRAEIKSADEVSGIRDFLAKYSGVTPVVEKDETLTQTNISASGDVLLHLITLAHRPLD